MNVTMTNIQHRFLPLTLTNLIIATFDFDLKSEEELEALRDYLEAFKFDGLPEKSIVDPMFTDPTYFDPKTNSFEKPLESPKEEETPELGSISSLEID